jgi:hypothetical protein
MIFLFSETFRPALVPAQPSLQWVPGFFTGLKRPGPDVDYSLLSRAVVRNDWRLDVYLYTPHIQGVPGGKDLTSGECSLGQTIPI